ncbi:MAG: SpoIIE family protein phosphatase [candidate division Zixibacteria bacterium]|nr:SpoIIE family protein phosphatase [candidate division Zixibacteria bacterium]
MLRRPVKEINAEFSAEEKYLDSIQRTVRESCVAAGMSRKDINGVLLAVEEGATNIIRHAYLYEKGIIRLRILIYRKLLVFSLIDFGRSFQPDKSERLNLEKLVESGRKGGLGFYMIQKIMDSVEYISSASFNELRMIKRTGGGRSESRPFLRRMFTLRVKFSFWTFFIVSIIIGGSFYYLYRQTNRQARAHLDQTVHALAKTIADQAAGYFINRRSDVEFDELIVSYLRANPELRLLVVTDSANVIKAHSEDIRFIGKPYQPPSFVTGTALEIPYRYKLDKEQLNYVIVPVKTGEKQIGLVFVSYTSAQIWQEVATTRTRIIIFTMALLLIGIFGIYMLSNYFVNPIARITQRVRRFTSGDLESELPLEGAEEFFEISRAFNEMMTRVSQDRKNIIAREKMAKEIEVASQVQKTLLPHKLPHLPGLQLGTFYRAASVIGGDLYDVFQIGFDRYCLVVADVSGKGVPASLVMSMLRTVIQIHASRQSSSRDVLIKVNNYLHSNIPPGMFITVMLAIYDAARREINFVSAGHNPMIYFRAASGEVSRVNPAGMPLGVPTSDGTSFADRLEEYRLILGEDDLFFIFTDGITEAVDRDKNQYGMERLVSFISRNLAQQRRPDVAGLSNDLVRELDDFAGFASPVDDMTFIVARSASNVGGSDSETRAAVDSFDIGPPDDSAP